MLFATTFLDALLNADVLAALSCPLGAIGLLIILLGVLALLFFGRESAPIKLLAFVALGIGIAMLFSEVRQPSSGLTAPPAYTLTRPAPPVAN
jgi:hypothetical protein